MKKHSHILFFFTIILCVCLSFPACGKQNKQITVVVRESGSGTREGFDKTVNNGIHFLEEKDESGKKVDNTTRNAIVLTKNGAVIRAVASDKNAIGYVSLGTTDPDIRAIRINGVFPTEETVLNGSYPIRRTFVIMTKSGIPHSERVADFMSYLKSDSMREHVEKADCFFLSDAVARANPNSTPIPVMAYNKQSSLPVGEKIVIRGSTSVEKLIMSAARGYADLYGADAGELFDIQLEGSSVGRRAVEEDSTGNVIGLSSATVQQDTIDSFNLCLDAVVVIVNRNNEMIYNLSLEQLYDIFSGSIQKFTELGTDKAT